MSESEPRLVPESIMACSPEDLVGREMEQQAIREAVGSPVRIVYLEGVGGIGKTRLLTEVKALLQNDQASEPYIFDVVDFYNTSMHGSLALEENLAYQIQEREGSSAPFAPFFAAVERFRTSQIDREEKVHEAFVDAYNAWADGRSTVLRFDTVELLEYGKDAPEVLSECEVTGAEAPALKWIESYLPEVVGATAIMAGRPTLTLREHLEEEYEEERFRLLRLDALTLSEAQEYFAASEYGRQIDERMIERIWLLSDGRPILLSLAIDWLASGMVVQEIYDADVRELRALKEEKGAAWEEVTQRFEQALVSKIRLLDTPLSEAIFYAARARKGFTAEMLRSMLEELSPRHTELTPEGAEALVNRLAKLSFVKQPYGARPGWYFLHDEMYDLVDKYVWHREYPGYTHQAEVAHYIATEIYGGAEGQGLIGEGVAEVKQARFYNELLQFRRHLDILRTEQLFYWLEADPMNGYDRYERLDIQAISQKNREWDDMLRIEILRFIHTLPRRALQGGLVTDIQPNGEVVTAVFLNRGCRARWVHRYFSRGRVADAIRISDKLLDLHPDWGGFWRARILMTTGAALVREGQAEARMALRDAVNILEGAQIEGDPWLIAHYRGTAQIYRGLDAKAAGDLPRALEAYRQAHDIFKANEEFSSVARALNNLAYVLKQQGKFSEATAAARASVEIRRDLGDIVGLALSLNTLSIVEHRAGTAFRARSHAHEALGLLQRAQSTGLPEPKRELALVYLNLGTIFRGLAQRNYMRERDKILKDWQEAEGYLKESEERIGDLEPYYRFDLLNQFGTLYKDWGNWTALWYEEQQEQEEYDYQDLMARANQRFAAADALAIEKEMRVERADNLEDWAWVFHLRVAYSDGMEEPWEKERLEEETLERLQEADEILAQVADPTIEGLHAHYIAGGVHHQWGRYLHKFGGDLPRALQHYALSVAYYDQFTLQPLERRERVMEHIQDTLDEQPDEDVPALIADMVKRLEARNLPGQEVRRLLYDIEADIEGRARGERYG